MPDLHWGRTRCSDAESRRSTWSLLVPMLALGVLSSLPARAEASAEQTYTLQAVLELALARNPAVASAEGTIEQNRGYQVASRTYPNPSVNANSGRGEIRDTGRADIRDQLSRQSIMEYNVAFGQPIEWPSKRAARQRASDAGLASASAGLVETRLNLAAEVKLAFYELLLAQRDADLAAQNLATIEDVHKAVRARVRLGESPQFEAIRSEVEILKAKQFLTRANNLVRVNRVVLDTLTAGALGPSYSIDGQFHRTGPTRDIDNLTQRALSIHPSIQRLAKAVEQADHALEFEHQARIPTITVGGSYWREIGREAFQAGLTIPTPLWDRRQGEIITAFGSKRKSEADLFRARNELIRNVNQHFQDAKTTADLIDVYEKGLLKQAEEALRIAKFSFQQGASSLIEVLDAQRVQRQILLDYTQAQYELSVALVRLERAVGGAL